MGSLMLGEEVPLMEDKSTLATLVREYVKISWREMGMTDTVEVNMLGAEVPLMENKLTMATLVKEYIRISWWEMMYELVSRGK